VAAILARHIDSYAPFNRASAETRIASDDIQKSMTDLKRRPVPTKAESQPFNHDPDNSSQPPAQTEEILMLEVGITIEEMAEALCRM
jgi:hypothetical protein